MKLLIRPDCADLPYFLRAYFAFKMGLPFGYAKCTRGSASEPPKCHAWWNIQNRGAASPARLNAKVAAGGGTFGDAQSNRGGAVELRPLSRRAGGAGGRASATTYAQTLADGVHSGSGRTRAADDNTDYYPVPLKRGHAASGHRVRRSVRAHSGDRAARAADRRRGRRLPRRRRAARRHGRAQALLARQLPVRRRSRARQPRLQALPADRQRLATATCGV